MQPSPFVTSFGCCRTAVTVERVGQRREQRPELARIRLTGDSDELRFEIGDRGITPMRARVDDRAHMVPVHRSRLEGVGRLGQSVQPSRDADGVGRLSVCHPPAVAQIRRGGQGPFLPPCTAAVERAHRAQALELETFGQPRQAQHIDRRLARRELVDRLFQPVQWVEHMFVSYTGATTLSHGRTAP